MQKTQGIGHWQEPTLRSQMTLSPLLRRTRQQRRANVATSRGAAQNSKSDDAAYPAFESGRTTKRRAAQRGC
jgi:hypothetical protein